MSEREPGRPNVNWPSTGKDDKNAGWIIISYLVAGMAIYGGLGWLVGQFVGAVRITTLLGTVVGLVFALALVIYRYGRS
jgi:ATP synthase protein I